MYDQRASRAWFGYYYSWYKTTECAIMFGIEREGAQPGS
jgi:hypothetical protein